jgi:hypothetical protein
MPERTAKMHCITLIVGSLPFRFVFQKENTARELVAALEPGVGNDYVLLADDFGQEFYGRRSSINGCILEDMEKSKLAHVEFALHQQRMQNLAQKMASADPGLRSMSNGPGVVTPFPRGN